MDAATARNGVTAIVEYDYTAKEPDELDLVKGAIIYSIKQMPGGWWEGTLKANGKTGMFPDNFVRVIDTTTTSENEESSVTLRDKAATKNRRCKVIYSYTQVNDDELSLAVGDVIEFLGEVEEGWWRGRLKTKIGVFPSNFVVDIEPSPVLASKRPTTAAFAATMAATTATPTTTTASKLTAVNSSTATTTNTSATTASALANAALAAVTTKKANRLSFHSSKEDLLNSTTTTTSSATTATTTSSAASDDVAAAPILPPKPQREYCRVEFPYAPQNDDELELKVGDVITIITTELPDKGWWKGELRGKVGVFPDNFVKMLAPPDVRVRFTHTKNDTINNTATTNINNTRTTVNSNSQNVEKAPIEIFGARMANFINTFFIPSSNESQQQSQQPQQTQHSQKTAKTFNAGMSSTTTNATTTTNIVTANSTQNSASNATSTTTISQTQSSVATAASTSKVFIKKSGSTSSTQSSNRKDSFGSYDSLNDILSETGLQTGNVAAQRKSLENKNLDLSNAPDAGIRMGLKKQQQEAASKTTITTSNNTTTTTSTSSGGSTYSSLLTTTSELRKSLENMDEKASKTTPPPVLTKKPSVPSKKSSTVTSVAANIFNSPANLFTSLKGKSKNAENTLTTSASQDAADGIGSSKMSPSSGSGLPDAAPSGNVVMRRAATIAVEDTDFDRVERASILTDMRAGRVKAPKRRPPSAAINAIGESNNNSIYLNGSSEARSSMSESFDEAPRPQSSDDNSTSEEQLAKPKPREWEKKKAPWMEELKASQVKKKTSPSVEPRTDVKATASAASSTTTKVQSSSISSSSTSTQQSTIVESSTSHVIKKEHNTHSSSSTTTISGNNAADIMSKSLSSKHTTLSTDATSPAAVDDVRAARPNSLSIRNRSISPSKLGVSSAGSARSASKSATSSSASPGDGLSTHATTTSHSSTAANKTTHHVNNHHQHHTASTAHQHAHTTSTSHANHTNGDGKILELERRIEKLESVVHTQQRTIDELVRTLREETDRVKVLRGELDKYAQCVTQV